MNGLTLREEEGIALIRCHLSIQPLESRCLRCCRVLNHHCKSDNKTGKDPISKNKIPSKETRKTRHTEMYARQPWFALHFQEPDNFPGRFRIQLDCPQLSRRRHGYLLCQVSRKNNTTIHNFFDCVENTEKYFLTKILRSSDFWSIGSIWSLTLPLTVLVSNSILRSKSTCKVVCRLGFDSDDGSSVKELKISEI